MDFPATSRDRLVMGLSIGALILFLANMATMVKRHFFDDALRSQEVTLVHVYGHGHDAHTGTLTISRSGHPTVRRIERIRGPRLSTWQQRDLGNGSVAWSLEENKLHTELDRVREEMASLEGRLRSRSEELAAENADLAAIRASLAADAARAAADAAVVEIR